MARKNKTPRYYNADDCKCCLYCCLPVITLSFVVEPLLKIICCCPCYYNQNNIVNPAPVDIPINDHIKDIYFGKIWGLNNNQI